jgi:diguanylate cyclase (GGDEF)-like protein
MAVSAVADGLYLYQEAAGTYEVGLADSLWLVGSLAVAAAALYPVREPIAGARVNSILLPTLFALLTVGILAADLLLDIGGLAQALAVSTVVVVVLRLVLSSRENAGLLEAVHQEAITDSLTELGNRRAMMRDLERALQPGGRNLVFALFDLDGFKNYNDTFGHPAGDLLLRRMGAALAAAARPDGVAYRLGGDEFCILIEADAAEAAATIDRAYQALSEDGEGFRIRASGGAAFLPREASDASGALGLADSRMYAQKGQRPSSAQAQTHELMVRVLVEREPDLGEHVSEVARMAATMGRHLDLGTEELSNLTHAAELHDIGKIGIPDRILHKPARLSPTEWELMQSHTLIGERILKAAPSMAKVARLVRASHERWDGKGYPDRLAGPEIPLGARVIFICDAFAAMISDRPYRQAIAPEAALEELRRCAGTQFDPVLVELFARTVYPGSVPEAEPRVRTATTYAPPAGAATTTTRVGATK